MVVLGIDPGISNLGLGVVEGDGARARFLHAELVRTRHGDPAAARVGAIYEAVAGAIAEHRPEAVAVEAQFFYRQNELAYKVGWAMGAVFLAAGQAGLEVFQYGPMEVKRALVGTGRADKRQVAFMVRALLGLKQTPSSSHAADALAVALTHLAHLRTGTTPRV
ncbi:crossover junction endodeoxyribonuclease RuvC [Oceanithermus profundus]|uniref:Crossover junction endodeoxyribonuclease RuvC n=1 Tax=Oceanithermus profundus (strain DSM 14977 / NBRC 100410 / VKM B-2274 / 506) TaxID=670487 RepID=E4U7K2_OCEP5|nr:crossover junction endodeoxyribonuclease RuvC [Oceanithermus profundus]ADR36451.1 Holliday junction endonuclease RuvC [Oceanithermus profundus DSM 14977]